ncbi:putative WRKY transcription factor 53 [Silene latifolia]|uniref:putative WRKY transcription factor 53 n=1 Tax=Silene latifolia TaxID=37657 RepID=UPI003D781039
MENNGIDPTNQKGLVDELIEGRDLTKQLYSILLKESASSSSSSTLANEAPSLSVTQKILSKIERSLSILRYEPIMVQSQAIDSPLSFNGTPKSTDSEGDSKDPLDCKEDSRKRKVITRSTLKVEGCCKSGLEIPVDDGFCWRKYGQKDILGAKYPRAYFRCTQRSQDCFATKQVQRSDNDPTYFEVTYRGKHTCYQAYASSSSSMPIPLSKPEPSHATRRIQPHQEVLWSFETNSNDIKPNNHLYSSSSFPPHFSSTHHNNNNNALHNYEFYDSNLFSPRIIRNNDFDNNHQRTNNNNNNNNNNNSQDDASNLVANDPLDITSELLSCVQGYPDFILENPHLFRE